MNINFYYVDQKYIDFLKEYETKARGFTCVPNVSYRNNNKFFYGTVFEINEIKYFVPVSSKHYLKQDDIAIVVKDKINPVYGTLRFLYMIPVPNECLKLLIRDELNDHVQSERIRKELAFCRRERDKIFKQARKTYYRVTNKVNEQLVKNACDFKLLEQAYIEYCTEHGLNYSMSDELMLLEQMYIECCEEYGSDHSKTD